MATLDLTALYREGLALQHAGQIAEALAIYNQILAAKPDIPEVLFQQARCLAETDVAAAEGAFRAALKGKPKEAAIWQGLHGVLAGPARVKLEKDAKRAGIFMGSEGDTRAIFAALNKGQAVQAEVAAARMVKLAPAAFWPAYALGAVRLALMKPAISPLAAAVLRDPTHDGARVALARAYVFSGRPVKAEQILSQATLSADGALLLARIFRDTARPEEAVALLQSSRLKPPRGPAELALALAQTGQSSAALKAAKTAMASGANALLLRATATAAEEAGDIAGAEAMIDASLTKANMGFQIHRAQLHQSAGDFAHADRLLIDAIDADPTSGEAFRAYMNGRKVMSDDPLLPALDAALSRADLKAADRAGLHFAAAKARGDLGAHEAVFAHLETANRLTAKAYPYGFDADLAEVRALAADWDTLRDTHNDDATPPVVFVTGLPRSGTTLIETILGAHPGAVAGGEMPFLQRALAPVMEALRHGKLTSAHLAEAGQRYVSSAQRRVGSDGVIIDKAISTFSRIGHAARALPNAKFVLVKRDPRDVALSLYRNAFAEGQHRYAYDLAAIGRYIRLHDAISDVWLQALPDRIHVVEYEGLTAAPEAEIRAMLQAVGMEWDDACLAPEVAGGRIQTLSFAQARQPIGTSAVAGWTRHEAELKPMIDALDVTFDVAP